MSEKLGTIFAKKSQINPSDFLVVDVETNGLSPDMTDLLCIAVYDPASGREFVRYLPLDLNEIVLTTYINGITDEDLAGKEHLSQEEVDDLFDQFGFASKTILSYSGSDFDERFLRAYFARHSLHGLNGLKFKDIKRDVFSPRNPNVKVTKDNLCVAMGIEGVREVHDALNDCKLEWHIFERMSGRCLFVTGDKLFAGDPDYLVPATFFDSYSRLRNKAAHLLPNIETTSEVVYALNAPPELGKRIIRFMSNFTGRAFEELIYGMLEVIADNNVERLIKNKSAMEYLGRIPTVDGFREVPLEHKRDGRVVAVLERDKELAEAITASNIAMKECLEPVIQYLKRLLGEDISSQELVINDEVGCLAVCDLSSEHAVVEIKTMPGFDSNKHKYQLYYQSHGRPVYVLGIDWPGHGLSCIRKSLTFVVRKISFRQTQKLPARKSTLIKHAVSDWRFANRNGGIRKCSEALYLSEKDIEPIFLKCDPSSFSAEPKKPSDAFNAILVWMKDNPEGTRLDCEVSTGLTRATVERWWYAAGKRLKLIRKHGSPERLRSQLGLLSDWRNTWGIPSSDEVEVALEQYWDLEQKADDAKNSRNWLSSAFAANDAMHRLLRLETQFLRGVGPRTQLFSILLEPSENIFCEGRTFLDLESLSIEFLPRKAGSKAKPAIEINYKTQILARLTASKNRSDYPFIEKCVGAKIGRAFVENDGKKVELFFALQRIVHIRKVEMRFKSLPLLTNKYSLVVRCELGFSPRAAQK